ncbi:hypothetical protein [Methanobacterium formicicum]|uniref:Uncharacterized protein n=1 Tax=Methanobacterium formicicum TaxID=2162 RepID=A0A843AMK2_METFO|nr:hypothetical protein [Methanobacterium formicicum]MBF4474370.1 hypothetical protein [Methanobacterium formicicum]
MLPVLLWGFIAYLKTSDKRFKWGIISILVTISLFIMGYLPFFIQARYFYLVYFLSFILGVYLLNEIIQRKNFKNHRKTFLLFIFFFLFVVSPFITLSYNANSYGGIYELSEILRNDYQVQGNIASDSEALTSFYMSYLLDSSYGGYTNTINLDLKLETEGVDYYLVWDTNDNVHLGSYTEIKHIEGMHPRVFKKNDQ